MTQEELISNLGTIARSGSKVTWDEDPPPSLRKNSSPITTTFVLPVIFHSVLSLGPQPSCEITPFLEGETCLWGLLAFSGLCCAVGGPGSPDSADGPFVALLHSLPSLQTPSCPAILTEGHPPTGTYPMSRGAAALSPQQRCCVSDFCFHLWRNHFKGFPAPD